MSTIVEHATSIREGEAALTSGPVAYSAWCRCGWGAGHFYSYREAAKACDRHEATAAEPREPEDG